MIVNTPGSDGPVSRGGTRHGSRSLLVVGGLIATILGLALVAHATISSVQPASDEGEPGDTVSAIVTVSTTGLTSCLRAASDIPLVITFDGLPTTCGTGTWFATMGVSIPATTPPGTYTVTISEVSLGGSLLGSHPWPLVVAAPTTATTLLPDPTVPTTLLPPSTTTPTDAVTTTTTTTSASSTSVSSSRTTTVPAQTTTTTRVVSTSISTEANEPGGPSPSTTGDGTTGPDLSAPLAAGEPNAVGEEAPFSEIAVTSGLIEVADRALPPVFAQAVLSPFVILEVLLRALGRTTGGLLIPLGVTTLAGFGLARRLRRDAEELPVLDDLVEIPEDAEGDDLS